jgi:hypothetical protein
MRNIAILHKKGIQVTFSTADSDGWFIDITERYKKSGKVITEMNILQKQVKEFFGDYIKKGYRGRMRN